MPKFKVGDWVKAPAGAGIRAYARDAVPVEAKPVEVRCLTN